MVKLVDTADLKSAAFPRGGVPVRLRLGAPNIKNDMKVKDVVAFLSKYPPNATVLGAGYAASPNEDGTWNCIEGELNVCEDKKGKPYLTVYGIEIIPLPDN